MIRKYRDRIEAAGIALGFTLLILVVGAIIAAAVIGAVLAIEAFSTWLGVPPGLGGGLLGGVALWFLFYKALR